MGSFADANVFALLDNENEDPQQLAAAQPKPAVKEVKSTTQKASEAKPAPVSKPTEAAPGRGEGARSGRGDRGRGRGGRGRGGRSYDRPEGGAVEETENGYAGYIGHDDRSEGRGGRGRGRGRGGRGRALYDGARPPRREFERHDGTGRGHEVVKRGGAGKGNWGAETETEIAEATVEAEKEVATGVADLTVEEAAPAAEGGEPAAEAPPVEEEKKEEEKPELTLEEYEAQLAEKRAALNKKGTVAQVDANEFKGLQQYKKEEEDMGLEVTSMKEKRGPKEKTRKEVVTVETNFKIAEEPRFGGGRGRRGRGRNGDSESGRRGGFGGRYGDGEREGGRYEGGRYEGGRYEGGRYEGGRGGGRGRYGGGRGYAPAIDDEANFPSLA